MLWLLLACTPEESIEAAPERTLPADWGPYTVGVDTQWYTDARGKEMVVDIWYPAIDGGEALHNYDPFVLKVRGLNDAKPDMRGGPYPLIAFTHGLGGIRFQSANLNEFWASHGFVVVAPDHVHNTLLDLDESLLGIVALERPGDVTSAIDFVHAHERFGLMVDPEAPIGVAGHSFGAVTSLSVGGAEINVEQALAYCETHNGDGCSFFKDDLTTEGAIIGAPDPRVVALASLAPGAWFLFGDNGENLQNTVPALMIGATQDTVLEYETEFLPTAERVASPKRVITLTDAGHWGFSDMCLLVPVFEDCQGEESGYMNPDRTMSLTQFATTMHLGWYLTGDAAYAPELWENWTGEDFQVQSSN